MSYECRVAIPAFRPITKLLEIYTVRKGSIAWEYLAVF